MVAFDDFFLLHTLGIIRAVYCTQSARTEKKSIFALHSQSSRDYFDKFEKIPHFDGLDSIPAVQIRQLERCVVSPTSSLYIYHFKHFL